MDYKVKDFGISHIDGISKEQMDLHLELYKGYVKNLESLDTTLTTLKKDWFKNTQEITELNRRINFELAGILNHELYFRSITPAPEVLVSDSDLCKKLTSQYGSIENFLEELKNFASMTRGIGWITVVYNKDNSGFHILWISDHEVGGINLPVILIIDMWEHAYLIDYKPSEKREYINSYLAALNWKFLEENFNLINQDGS